MTKPKKTNLFFKNNSHSMVFLTVGVLILVGLISIAGLFIMSSMSEEAFLHKVTDEDLMATHIRLAKLHLAFGAHPEFAEKRKIIIDMEKLLSDMESSRGKVVNLATHHEIDHLLSDKPELRQDLDTLISALDQFIGEARTGSGGASIDWEVFHTSFQEATERLDSLTEGLDIEIESDMTKSQNFFRLTLLLWVALIIAASAGLFDIDNRRRRAESAKKKSEWLLQSLLDNSTAVIYMKDLDGRYLLINHLFEELFHITKEEILGKTDDQIFPPHVAETFRRNDLMVIENEASVSLEEEAEHDDGPHTYISLKFPVMDEDGRFYAVCGISTDIMERKAMEQELYDAYEKLIDTQSQVVHQAKMVSVGHLAAGMAHEINNPLGFISSNLQTLKRYTQRLIEFIDIQASTIKDGIKKGSGDEAGVAKKRLELDIDHIKGDVSGLLSESISGAQRVTKIIRDLKSFSGISTSKGPTLTDIRECISAALNVAHSDLTGKVELCEEYGDVPLTMCEPLEMNQVFFNLLRNAAEATTDKGKVTICTWSDDDFIYASVADTGVGIPKEALESIFNPFFTTKKETGDSVGLGLSISYEIMKKHGGEITVESVEGEGATFTVKLPIREN